MTENQTPKAPKPKKSKKKPWLSKTMAVALLTAVIPAVYPPAAAVIAANPTLVAALTGALFAGLRAMTDGGISLSDE